MLRAVRFFISISISGMTLVQLQSFPVVAQPELKLSLQPERLLDGVPQAFTFVLTNISNDALYLPQPGIDCANQTAQGSFWLNESWQPATGTGLAKGFGSCDSGGSFPAPLITDSAKQWKLLKPVESIYVDADNKRLHYETSNVGDYIFSAVYLPPSLSTEARRTLKGIGIDVPKQKAVSESLRYRKN